MSQAILSKLNTTDIDELSSSRNEPDWLKDYRKIALSIYDDLPLEMSPLYNKYTDAKKMDPEKVSLSTSTTATVPDFLKKRLKILNIDAEVFVGGSYAKNTMIKKDSYDIDIFLRFSKDHKEK